MGKGSFSDNPQINLETCFILDGGAGAALYTFKQPDVYAYVNYNLIEAILKSAVAHVVVDGKWDNNLLEQIPEPADIKIN